MEANPNFDPLTQLTYSTIRLFNECVNRHDVDAIMDLMTIDCVFENTYPPPDGEKFEGQAAVRGFWAELFENSPNAHFEFEEIFASGSRAFARWLYRWQAQDGETGHVRGVDIFTIRAGKVSEKLSYVKG